MNQVLESSDQNTMHARSQLAINELLAIAQRLEVAKRLREGDTYLEICDKTMDVVQYIEQVSDHDISVSKVVAACSFLML